MESLIDNATFLEASDTFCGLVEECEEDYYSDPNSVFVGICLSECEDGLVIKARHSCQSNEQLMAALQGTINLFFANHPKEEE